MYISIIVLCVCFGLDKGQVMDLSSWRGTSVCSVAALLECKCEPRIWISFSGLIGVNSCMLEMLEFFQDQNSFGVLLLVLAARAISRPIRLLSFSQDLQMHRAAHLMLSTSVPAATCYIGSPIVRESRGEEVHPPMQWT